MALPAVIHDTTLANPIGGGLLAAATIVDLPDPTRLGGGVLSRSRNCGPTGLWDPACDPEPPNDPKTGDRAPDGEHPGYGLWATDECDLRATTREDSFIRARQLLRLHESRLHEQHLAPRLATAAGTPLTIPDGTEPALVRALGLLEESLGSLPGVVHASARYAAIAEHLRLIHRQGGQLLTPLGHRWAFGSGYSPGLGTLLVATGPVAIHRGPVIARDAISARDNAHQVVAEREATASWECAAHAIDLAPTP